MTKRRRCPECERSGKAVRESDARHDSMRGMVIEMTGAHEAVKAKLKLAEERAVRAEIAVANLAFDAARAKAETTYRTAGPEF